ncbi:MAG: hypothetical protein Q4A31_09110, partial [Corynebacterium sp.]|uniref:hypothetical protein n=1 Tax=Corynebacterium sp. TaxID=1720 RepID=UPI0026DBB95F
NLPVPTYWNTGTKNPYLTDGTCTFAKGTVDAQRDAELAAKVKAQASRALEIFAINTGLTIEELRSLAAADDFGNALRDKLMEMGFMRTQAVNAASRVRQTIRVIDTDPTSDQFFHLPRVVAIDPIDFSGYDAKVAGLKRHLSLIAALDQRDTRSTHRTARQLEVVEYNRWALHANQMFVAMTECDGKSRERLPYLNVDNVAGTLPQGLPAYEEEYKGSWLSAFLWSLGFPGAVMDESGNVVLEDPIPGDAYSEFHHRVAVMIVNGVKGFFKILSALSSPLSSLMPKA